MRHFCRVALFAVGVCAYSSVWASITIEDNGEFRLTLEASYLVDPDGVVEFDSDYINAGKPTGSASVTGAEIYAEGGYNYADLTYTGSTANISASGFLDVTAIITEASATATTGGSPPNSVYFLTLVTTEHYAFDYFASAQGAPSTIVRFYEGDRYGSQVSGSSGILSPGTYTIWSEADVDFGVNQIGRYESRSQWEYNLELTPVMVPEVESLVAWGVGLLTIAGGVLWRCPLAIRNWIA